MTNDTVNKKQVVITNAYECEFLGELIEIMRFPCGMDEFTQSQTLLKHFKLPVKCSVFYKDANGKTRMLCSPKSESMDRITKSGDSISTYWTPQLSHEYTTVRNSRVIGVVNWYDYSSDQVESANMGTDYIVNKYLVRTTRTMRKDSMRKLLTRSMHNDACRERLEELQTKIAYMYGFHTMTSL